MSKLHFPVTQHDHVVGPPTAAVTLVEYGDYECPHCGRAHQMIKMLRARFGKHLRFAFRHFPLAQIHPNAEPAAETAEYAGVHSRFWEMHDAIYENQDRLGVPLMLALAGLLGLPESGLRNALMSGEFKPRIRNDSLGGVLSGVSGTPTFFINDERHDGSYTLEELSEAIASQLPVKVALGR